MACEGCKYPMHEQFRGYLGRWLCFSPEIKNTGRRKICDTPVEEWGDTAANNRRLGEAKTPRWCPGSSQSDPGAGGSDA